MGQVLDGHRLFHETIWRWSRESEGIQGQLDISQCERHINHGLASGLVIAPPHLDDTIGNIRATFSHNLDAGWNCRVCGASD